MKILITGPEGFIAKNLIFRLKEAGYHDIVSFGKKDTLAELENRLAEADFIIHLAGVNRPLHVDSFDDGNKGLTQLITNILIASGRSVPLVLSSSIQAEVDHPYGRSKAAAESSVIAYSEVSGAPSYIFRLPNVFGKWSKPNYNSVVATFCHNIANGISININEERAPLSLVYIDDVCTSIIELIGSNKAGGYEEAYPVYKTTVGEVAELIESFAESRETLSIGDVGVGLTRALYSTYLSYLKPEKFSYKIAAHSDARGTFVEMLKTHNAGQFSFFTAHPGVIRGGHYHHSKNEKFLVVKGHAKFRFQNVISSEKYEISTVDTDCTIVETVPGWVHDIENIGNDLLVVMLWANEIFNNKKPDTISRQIL